MIDNDALPVGIAYMTPATALALAGTVAGFAAVLVLVVRFSYEASDQSTLALARSGGVRLKELQRRTRNGALDAASADAARVALLRELLGTDCARQSQWWFLRGDGGALVVIGLAALAMGCFSLLPLTIGAPTSSADALESSASQQDPDLARLELYAKSKAPRLSATPAIGLRSPQELPDVETMIERLAARLQSAPEDADGWRMLGWSYFHIQQAPKAAEAYARAVSLRPQSSELKSAYGEALVAAEAGSVTPKAIEMFNAALMLDARNPKARFFVALAKEQAGNKLEALEELRSLLAEPLEEEPWVTKLRERTQILARELNVEVSVRIPAQAAPPDGKDAWRYDGTRRPAPDEIRSLQALPANEQQKMIRGMVAGLADRLQRTPRHEDGWLRLIRSRVVLGEQQVAREALTRALAAFSDDASAGARIVAAARELGVTSN